MKRFIITAIIVALIAMPVSAMDFVAPEAPEAAERYMPDSSSSFAKDLWYIIKTALAQLFPSVSEAAGVCVSVLALIMLSACIQGLSNTSTKTVELASVIAIGTALLSPANALISIGIQTIEAMSEYGKLLLPVMTAALAAEGGTATSTALYSATVVFNTVMTSGITTLLIPMLYAFIALSIAKAAMDEQVLKNLQDFLKWLITWTLKISIYIFTGYLSITGVVSGTVDAAAVKAAKLAISGSVPVIGSIISDASETILVSAGIMKNAAGVYGLLAILATWIGPFLQISVQYLMLKITCAVCSIFGCKRVISLIDSFSTVMGFLVAMIGTICLLLLISTVCFMKGVG